MTEASATSTNGEAAAASQNVSLPPSQVQSAMRVLTPRLFGHAAAMTMKTAVQLNIPDILARAEPESPSLSIHEIAAQLASDSMDKQALHRIMRALVHLGVFSATQELHSDSGTSLARYGLTPASRMLVRENNPRTHGHVPQLPRLADAMAIPPWNYLARKKRMGSSVWNGMAFVHRTLIRVASSMSCS